MLRVGDLIAILEDDPERVNAMRACLAEAMLDVKVVVFDDAQRMIVWLCRHLSRVALISLDHDLRLRNVAGATIDCGTGRQVADYLASMSPACPVVVHSSNPSCAPGMFFALRDAGWRCSQVRPYDDLAWVRQAWTPEVLRQLRG